MRRLASILALTALVVACDDGMPTDPAAEAQVAAARTGPAGLASYTITVENLTDGQPLTPPLAAIHRPAISLYEVGAPASTGIQQIAENGNLAPLAGVLGDAKHVMDYVIAVGTGVPPVLPGDTRSFDLESTRGAKLFSFASMLICTNDGFTGVSGVRLPDDVGEAVTVYANAYDAGTEMNTEAWPDLVPPCAGLTGLDNGGQGTGMSNPALFEGGVVHPHPGISGGADLVPAIHDWDGPVARVTITRIG